MLMGQGKKMIDLILDARVWKIESETNLGL